MRYTKLRVVIEETYSTSQLRESLNNYFISVGERDILSVLENIHCACPVRTTAAC